jgi:O-antigen/teichoic acid export membrane protein
MTLEAKTTVRNAELLVVQQGANLLSAFAFAALVPRWMGPEVYGRYALINSLIVWFVLAGGMGFTAVLSRFIPRLVTEGKDIREFTGGLLTVRLITGLLIALLFLTFSSLWLRDSDPRILVFATAMVFAQVLVYFYYTFFLGINRAAHWGMGQVIRGWASFALLLIGYRLAGLLGAFLGLLIAELIVLAVGLWWARPHRLRPILWPDWNSLAPCFRFGLIFFIGDLLIATNQRSGQALVAAVTGDYVQVGYFGAAHNIFITVALILPQLALAFLPLLSSLSAQGRLNDLKEWIERLLKWLAVLGMLVVFAVLLLGDDLIPLVLGEAFRPMVFNLLILTLALPLWALITVARVLAMVWNRPGIALEAAAIQMTAFFSLGGWFIARQASLGGCLAVLAAMTLSGMYITWRMKRVMPYSVRSWMSVIVLGGLFAPLVWLRSNWMTNSALFALFLLGYGGLLLLTRTVSRMEMISLWRVVRWKRMPIEPVI